VLVDANNAVAVQSTGLVHHHVQRQAYRQVGLEGRIHRHQGAFGGVFQWGVGCDDTVQHGLAVLGFANLEVGRLIGGFDEIARRVNLEQAHALVANLAAKDHGHIEIHTCGTQCGGIALVHATHGGAQHAARVEHAFRVPDGQGLILAGLHQFFHLQHFAHRLRDAEVASRQQHHETVARLS